ncbi:MAG: uroporphyrinogen decarboxylase family protein [Anaerolineae bacterium]
MNNRDRFRHVLRFERVDRLPRFEWATWWDQTIRRWEGEGLPAERPAGEAGVVAIMEYFGLDPAWQVWFPIHKPTYPSMPHGEGPVSDMASYEAIREHLYPEVDWDAAFPAEVRERHERGDLAVWFTLNGFFWFPRQLLGIQRHLFAFYDQPALMHRINEDLLAYNKYLLKGIANIIEPEFMTFAEDLSYNHGPMLSRASFNEFLAPYYRELTPLIRAMNVIPMVDSDGNVEKCLPWFIECGVEGLLPFERQSGVDVARVRANHPRFAMIGAFDKMTMNQGIEAMRAEWERLLPVMRTGGFIPSVDHQTPPGVSLAQYRDYLALMWEYTALDCGTPVPL